MEWLQSIAIDLRYAVRTLRRAPVFTVVVTLTLALGIGATSAIFSLVDGILLRPLPYANPDQLVRVIQAYPEKGLDTWALSQQNIAMYRDGVGGFSSFAAYRLSGVTLTGDGAPERLSVGVVSGDFFSLLGVRPEVGRVIGRDDDRPHQASVAVLSYGFWQSHFGGHNVLGKTLDLDGQPVKIVGVMPRGFLFPRGDAQLFMPLGLDPTRRFGWFLAGLGRLRPGVSAAAANKEATAVMWNWARSNPDLLSATAIDPGTTRMHAIVMPLRDALTGNVARPLIVLQAAVVVLLLIAIANIATLLSSRAVARVPELAVRTALGATSRRIARQLLTESVALALLGGVLGLVVAFVAVKAFVHWSPRSVPRLDSVRVDAGVLGTAFIVTIASGVLFGLSPALRVARIRRIADDLSGSHKQSATRSARRLNHTLIVAQLALSTVLLVSAGLVAKSFQRLLATDLGFAPHHVLGVTLALPMKDFMTPDRAAAATQAIVDRVRRLPTVTNAAAASYLPFSGGVNTDGFLVEGHAPPANAGAESQVVQVQVTPGFFGTLGIPLRFGREISSTDIATSVPVVVVDDALARRYWKGADAIGKRIRYTGDTTWMTIVGVVGSVRDQDVVEDPVPHAYQPFAQVPVLRPALAIQTSGDAAPVVAQVRRIVHDLQPATPVSTVELLDDSIGQALDNQRLTELLLVGFSLIAAGLAAVGVYGVMALYVAHRQREFGIRLAVGARPGNLVGLVLRQGLLLACGGLALGLAVALAVTRSLGSLLYEVSPFDPVVFAAIALGLFVVAALTCVTPARRAAKSDPLIALRDG